MTTKTQLAAARLALADEIEMREALATDNANLRDEKAELVKAGRVLKQYAQIGAQSTGMTAPLAEALKVVEREGNK